MTTWGVAIDAFYGVPQKRVYVCFEEGDGFTPVQNKRVAAYIAGELPPDYPVPALYDDYSNPNVWDCVVGYYVAFG